MSDLFDFLGSLPLWLIVAVLAYMGVLITVAVVRGQEVQFWPPRIGARPAREPITPAARPGPASVAPPFANLDGKWYVYYGFDTQRTKEQAVGIADIRQQSNRFSMTVQLHRSKIGRTVENTFEYEGEITNRRIITHFKATHPPGSFMVGAMVLYPSLAGDRLFGGAVYVNRHNKIVMDPCLLKRD